MSVDFTFVVGPDQQTQDFHFHQIHTVTPNRQRKRLTIYQMRSTVVRDITATNGKHYDGLLRISDDDAQQIREVERLLAQQIQTTLGQPNYSLKSEVNNDTLLSFRLAQIRGQLTCKIMDNSGKYITYSEINSGDQVEITLKLESIWSRDDCYGTFLYKWKAVQIRKI